MWPSICRGLPATAPIPPPQLPDNPADNLGRPLNPASRQIRWPSKLAAPSQRAAIDHGLAPTNAAMPPISFSLPLHTDPISSHHQIIQLFASKQRRPPTLWPGKTGQPADTSNGRCHPPGRPCGRHDIARSPAASHPPGRPEVCVLSQLPSCSSCRPSSELIACSLSTSLTGTAKRTKTSTSNAPPPNASTAKPLNSVSNRATTAQRAGGAHLNTLIYILINLRALQAHPPASARPTAPVSRPRNA